MNELGLKCTKVYLNRIKMLRMGKGHQSIGNILKRIVTWRVFLFQILKTTIHLWDLKIRIVLNRDCYVSFEKLNGIILIRIILNNRTVCG